MKVLNLYRDEIEIAPIGGIESYELGPLKAKLFGVPLPRFAVRLIMWWYS